MTEEEIVTLGNALLSLVFDLSIPKIRSVAGAAGIDAAAIPAKSEESGGHGSRAEVIPVVQRLSTSFPYTEKDAHYRSLRSR